MKKSLFALAALGAFAGAAQAQSSVTLYGTLDAGLYYGSKVGGDIHSDSTKRAWNGPAASQAGKDVFAFADSTVVSSVWGLKGAEDLGGGLKGIFQVEGDLQLNNGGLAGAGLFRRAANVGLQDAKLGELALGLKGNPLIAAHAGLMPVAGNSVSTNLSGVGGSSFGYGDFFTRNAVTYTSPNLMGLTVVAQAGLGNTVNQTNKGNVYAFSGVYTGIQGLKVTAAYQSRIGMPEANNTNSTTDGGLGASAANYATAATGTGAAGGTSAADNLYSQGKKSGRNTVLGGISYKLGNFTAAYGYVYNDLKSQVNLAGKNLGTNVHSINQFGLGYQATPKLLLGATYAFGSWDWKLANVQARYSLSPRTTAYAQVGVAMNGKYAAATPIANQTGTQPTPVVQGYGAAANTTQTAVGAGVIHTF